MLLFFLIITFQMSFLYKFKTTLHFFIHNNFFFLFDIKLPSMLWEKGNFVIFFLLAFNDNIIQPPFLTMQCCWEIFSSFSKCFWLLGGNIKDDVGILWTVTFEIICEKEIFWWLLKFGKNAVISMYGSQIILLRFKFN